MSTGYSEHIIVMFLLVSFCIPSDIDVSSFGVSFMDTNIDDSNLQIYLHLNWDGYSFHCNASYNNIDNRYLCDVYDATTICNYTHYVASNGLYSITISNTNEMRSVMLDQIIVNRNDNSYHIIDSFCLDDNYHMMGHNEIHLSNCTDFDGETEYEYINITHSNAITVYFITNIHLWRNSYEPGLLQIVNTHKIEDKLCENIKVESFGFEVTPDMMHNADVILTLYWFDQILQCVIHKTEFMCNESDIILIGTNTANTQYKMQFAYNNEDVFGPSSIFVIDLFGNRYDVHFCGTTQYLYWNTHSSICPQMQEEYMYLYTNLKMDNTSINITVLYIEFDDILLYSNTYSMGIISSAKITHFGIKATVSVESTLHLTLHWNSYVYLCSFTLHSQLQQTYLCNVSDTTGMISECLNDQYKFRLIINGPSPYGIEINNVYIVDETNYEYNIHTFCQNTQYNICTDIIQCESDCLLSMIIDINKKALLILDTQLSCDVTTPPTSNPTVLHTPITEGIIIMISFVVIMVLSFMLIGCCCYVRILQTKLEQSKQNGATHEAAADTFDLNATIEPLSGFELTPINTEREQRQSSLLSVLPPGQPKGKHKKSTKSTDSRSIYSDPSQNAEGYQRPTKLESAVRLEVIKSSIIDDDVDEDYIVLHKMLEDVMRMKSKSMDYQSVKNKDSDDSDNSDGMYDKSDSEGINNNEDEKMEIELNYETPTGHEHNKIKRTSVLKHMVLNYKY